MRRSIGLLLLFLCAACAQTGSAVADPYPVTNTNDSGEGSLRAAVVAANAHTGADTIPIEVTGTINLLGPLQVIFDPVAIVGPGAGQLEVRRNAVAGFSVFAISADSGPSSIAGLTVSNGGGTLSGNFALGGGIRNGEGSLTLTRVVVRDSEAVVDGGTNVFAEGGGVFSDGPLTLRETEVVDNAALASGGTTLSAAFGGGVAAQDILVVEDTTISGNFAEADGGGTTSIAQGGGLAGTEATVSRSTISGNGVDVEGGTSQNRAQGGGIQVQEATITASTLSGNSAVSTGLAFGANLESIVSTTVSGTIVAEPLGEADSCHGGGPPGSEELSSGGFNLDEDGSCEFDQGTDLAGVSAGLEPLAANGGPTPTHALRADSPALDRGDSFGSSVDQRGLARPVDLATRSNSEGGDGSDIGAFELQALPGGDKPLPAPILVSTTPGDRTAPDTRITRGPARVTFKRRAKFRFNSTESQSSFQCKVDNGKWRGCRSPFKRTVSAGRKHVFRVRAIDRFGNVDPTPARFGWRVKALS